MKALIGWARGANDWVISRAVAAVATVECIWLFTAWSLLPLAAPRLEQVVFYVSGGILQLVLLPAIMYQGRRDSAKAEQRAAEDHEAIKSILTTIIAHNAAFAALLREESGQTAEVRQLMAEVHASVAARGG